MKERKKWIDVARGLSIILVVMGHAGNELINPYLGWFRMPLFFLVSGLLFKEVPALGYWRWAVKRVRFFLVPYCAYGICIAILVALKMRDLSSIPKDLLLLAYGGTVLGGWYGVFWFITCLLVVHLLMGYLSRFSLKKAAIAVALCYAAAHAVSMSPMAGWDIPWNADVALMAIVFFFLGYIGKTWLPELLDKGSAFIPALMVWFLAAGLNMGGLWTFRIDMKYKIYNQPLLDLIVPIACVLVVLQLCYWASRYKASNALAFLGTVTIAIMYLHVPVNIVLEYGLGLQYGTFVFTAAGVIIPLGIAWLLSQSKLLSMLFLGPNGFGRKKEKPSGQRQALAEG
ncbi:acyltransferase family protein [Paenibacillus sp. NEAU-GSW1]|uniref:acyltransferase family protein n=1 Tax=Paenibacillus sp. NEAU-GSW1 TaxID=2682486 RepID=UPI0012E263FB|nr:acyltransferase family protein [Paenibacillus sp. NEAU-GSW1]